MIHVAIRVADVAVIDIADDDDFQRAIAIHIGDGRGAVGKVGPVFRAALGISAQIGGLIYVNTYLAPDGARAVDAVDRQLIAAAVQSRDVMRVGRADDFLETIIIQIGYGDVLVIHAPAVAQLAITPGRPAGSNRAVGLKDVELLGVSTAASP